MPLEPERPRKSYALKTRDDFETVNPPATPTQPAPTAPIDVRDHCKIAADSPPVSHAPVNRPNDVHALLQLNQKTDVAVGWFQFAPGSDERRKRRLRFFWTALILVDGPLGYFAWRIGHENAVPFVFVVAGVAMFTAVLIWHSWFLNTE